MKKTGIALLLAIACLAACKKTNTDLAVPPLSDYWNPTVGKYIIYRLDSTVLTQFGAGLTVHSYRVKDLVEQEIVDGTGRKSYRVTRTITDVNGVGGYAGNATFMVTPVGTDWIEMTVNGLRYMKLRNPIRNDFSWAGHSFIDATSINSPVRYLADWNYTYQKVGMADSVLGKRYDTTATVLQRDETIPEGPFINTAYKQRNYGIEVYGKGIGLIYKEFLHYIYQPPTSTRAGYYEDESYGVKLQIIEHN